MPNHIKGYYTNWNPHKKTVMLLDQVNEVFDTYREQLPLTLRQVFYILVANYDYEKTEKAYKRLGSTLSMARRAQRIPFEYLRDDSLSGYENGHYKSEDDFWSDVRSRGKRFTLDKQSNQDVYIRVHAEAAGMLMQLRNVCNPYSIPVYSCSGFDSLTVKYDLCDDALNERLRTGRTTVVLHLGDLDPSGVSIFDSMVEDVTSFVEGDLKRYRLPAWDVGDVVQFERVALLPFQASLLGLPSAPPKATDTRSKNWQGDETYQLEAIPPDVLARYLEIAIEGWLDLGQLDEDRETEGELRKGIARHMRALPSGD